MLIHAIQAEEGDCLLLESDGAERRYALIDGGPRGVYNARLAKYLTDRLGAGGVLQSVIVSHVDSDHIMGVLDLVSDLERAKADGDPPPFVVEDVWHNSFAATLDDPEGTLASGLRAMMSLAGRAQVAMTHSGPAFLGIREGASLRRLALKLGIPINDAFGGSLICPDQLEDPTWQFGDATVLVVGPTRANLRELQKQWKDWLADHLDAFVEGDTQAMANSDRSVPNLSSIVLLASTQHGDALLTGDARGDHILQGLEASGRLAPGGSLHLRVLKLQHHGSFRNIDASFLRRLPADLYLVSANGKHDNPDIDTLRAIVDVAGAEGRAPTIVVTNETDSTRQLLIDRPPAQHGYRLEVRDPQAEAVIVDVASAAVV